MESGPAIRARVPDQVSAGAFSTGAIIVTGNTEFLLDFVRNLGKPNQVVARVVIPHLVLPQFVDALAANIDLYRKRFGALPADPLSSNVQISSLRPPGTEQHPPLTPDSLQGSIDVGAGTDATNPSGMAPGQTGEDASGANAGMSPDAPGSEGVRPPDNLPPVANPAGDDFAQNLGESSHAENMPPVSPAKSPRRQSPEEVYDDLKIPDEILSGRYANAVMIGHGPHEFSFDFISNFYPQSAVSARVFLAAGQVERLLDSMQKAWEQVKPRIASVYRQPQRPTPPFGDSPQNPFTHDPSQPGSARPPQTGSPPSKNDSGDDSEDGESDSGNDDHIV